MGPNDCWWAWLLIVIQTMVGLLMDAVIIGEGGIPGRGNPWSCDARQKLLP
jgi:hypothetical protein